LLLKRDEYFSDSTEKGIGLCGYYVPARDSVHVGIFIDHLLTKEIVHFWGANDIRIEHISLPHFANYYFLPLKDFPKKDIISLSVFAELIKSNSFNNLQLNIGAIAYNGAIFNVRGDYVIKSEIETVINCGVFVIALFESFKFKLLDWNTWPSVSASERIPNMEDWLNYVGIPLSARQSYYNINKEIRGKHVFATTKSKNRPASFWEIEKLAEKIINLMRVDNGIPTSSKKSKGCLVFCLFIGVVIWHILF
jgi:hypothetical protein